MTQSSQVEIGELLLVEGASLLVERSVSVAPIVATTSRLLDDEPVSTSLTLFGSQGELTAVGTVSFAWAGECRRCLEEVRDESSVTVEEVFSPTPEAGESYPLEGDGIDLLPLLVDAVTLSLPLTPLCRTDCLGPQPDRFPVEVVVDDPEPALDPRWAALDELRTDD